MSKLENRRSRGNVSPSAPVADTARRSDSPAKRHAPDARPLLARILDTPHLPQVIRRLQPEVLHRVIDRCGLEDCGELVTLASPAQLAGVLDLDLWRQVRSGSDEQFDAARFGVWLEVLVDQGAEVAARTLASLDTSLVVAALAQHIRVFDVAAKLPPGGIDDEDLHEAPAPGDEMSCEVGGYLVESRRPDAWDAIVAVLTSLHADHPASFRPVMRGCCRLSNSRREIDGLDNLLEAPEQVMFDLASDRERRREMQGYTAPAEARAFLEMSRRLRAETDLPRDPVAANYFRAMNETIDTPGADANSRLAAAGEPSTTEDSGAAAASLVDVLIDEGVLPRPPRALLDAPIAGAPRYPHVRALLQTAHDSGPDAYAMRTRELAFLANTIASGCSMQARPFTLQEASDAAIAVCNLGLENAPPLSSARSAGPGAGAGDSEDLVAAFQVGWRVLHQQVCMFAAERLIAILKSLKCEDSEIQAGLRTLRFEMTKCWKAGAPWRARDALDVLTSLDMPAWATLLGLLDECPVIHAAMRASTGSGARTISASAFEFISDNSQIESVRAFMQSLPAILRG